MKQKQGRNKSSKAESSIGKICHQRFSFPLPLRHSSLWPLLPFFLHRQSLAPPDFQSISFFVSLSFITERKAWGSPVLLSSTLIQTRQFPPPSPPPTQWVHCWRLGELVAMASSSGTRPPRNLSRRMTRLPTRNVDLQNEENPIDDSELVPYSLAPIVPILRVANEVEKDNRRVAYLCKHSRSHTHSLTIFIYYCRG